VNYFRQIKAFYDLQYTNKLSNGQAALWHTLMHINNTCAWKEWFTVPNQVLESFTDYSRKGIYNARNVLKQKGYIDFKSNGTLATSYHLMDLAASASTQDGEEGFPITQGSTQNSTQSSTQNSTQSSTQSSATLIDIDNTKTKTKDICAFFDELWKLYPKKEGKGKVSAATKQKLYAIGIEEMSRCIERYKAAKSETDRKFWVNGGTFFNSGYVDYLDENWEPHPNASLTVLEQPKISATGRVIQV